MVLVGEMDGPVKFDDPKLRYCLCLDPLKPVQEPTFCSIDAKFVGKRVTTLCPITPNPSRENEDPISLINSPLSSDSPKSSNEDSSSPRTPEGGVFDPFAPGPEELLLAPLCRKIVKGCGNVVARRLNFGEDDDEELSDVEENAKEVEMLCEKIILDTVYGILLEAIIEDFLAEQQSESRLRTPTSSFTGIACPKAPMRAIAIKPRNIDPRLCRKLEF